MLHFDNLQIVKMETGEVKMQLQFVTDPGDDQKRFSFTPKDDKALKFLTDIGREIRGLMNDGAISLQEDFTNNIRDLNAEIAPLDKPQTFKDDRQGELDLPIKGTF